MQLLGCICVAHGQQVCALQIDLLTERNSSLLRRVAEAEGANAVVKGQLQEFCQKLRLTQVDNSLLQQQIAFLQKQQKVSIIVCLESPQLLGVRHTAFPELPDFMAS